MEILTTYNNDTLQLITDSENSYFIPNFWEHYVDSYFDLKDGWNANSVNGLMNIGN